MPASPPLKHRLRATLDRVADAAGVLRLCQQRMGRGLTVLMYHRVLPAQRCYGYPLPALVIPEPAFRQQVAWLAEHARVLPLGQALDALQPGQQEAKPLVAITFDDGYHDNHDIAAPILEQHDLRATFFITSGFVETAQPLWFDKAAHLWLALEHAERAVLFSQVHHNGQPRTNAPPALSDWMEALKRAGPDARERALSQAENALPGDAAGTIAHEPWPMTAEQVGDLARRGHEVGGHTVSHPILPQLNDQQLHDELAGCREKLQAWIDQPVASFCYPNGDYDERVARAVEQAGYTCACTTAEGLNDSRTPRYRLHRLPITMQRTVPDGRSGDSRGFRAEISRFRHLWR